MGQTTGEKREVILCHFFFGEVYWISHCWWKNRPPPNKGSHGCCYREKVMVYNIKHHHPAILQANIRQMLLLYLAFDKPKCSSQVLSLTALQVIVGNRWFLSVKHRDIRKVNEIIQLRAERTFIMRFAAQIRDSLSFLNACWTADKPERCRQEQDLISRRLRGVCVRAQMVCIYEDAASCCWGCSFHHTTPTLDSVAPTWRTIPANLARLFKAI